MASTRLHRVGVGVQAEVQANFTISAMQRAPTLWTQRLQHLAAAHARHTQVVRKSTAIEARLEVPRDRHGNVPCARAATSRRAPCSASQEAANLQLGDVAKLRRTAQTSEWSAGLPLDELWAPLVLEASRVPHVSRVQLAAVQKPFQMAAERWLIGARVRKTVFICSCQGTKVLPNVCGRCICVCGCYFAWCILHLVSLWTSKR